MFFRSMLFAVFLAALFLNISAVRAEVAAASPPATFTLQVDEIVSWYVGDNRLYFQMQPDVGARLGDFTQENLNKQINFYIGDILVSSPFVRSRIDGGYGLIVLAPEFKESLLASLPADREKPPATEE